MFAVVFVGVTRAGKAIKLGTVKGLRTAVWLLEFTIPVSLLVTLLAWTGALEVFGRAIEPAFRLLGLPGESAVAYLSAAFLNNYSGIAAIRFIPVDDRQVTILALMMLVCHNLPLESTIQHKSGSSGPRMALLRLGASVLGALLLNWLMPAASSHAHQAAASPESIPLLGDLLVSWARGMGYLAAKLTLLLIGLMVLQQFLQEFGLIPQLARLLAPLLWLLGLPRRTAFLWIVANTLGLGYGAGVIMSEVESGAISDEEIDLLNHSIALCHSLLEDTLLFVAIGAWAFWITFPRLVLAAVSVWVYRAVNSRKRR